MLKVAVDEHARRKPFAQMVASVCPLLALSAHRLVRCTWLLLIQSGTSVRTQVFFEPISK